MQTTHFIIYLARLSDQQAPRLGLAVSRQIGNAVARNRTKRRLRESFRRELKPMMLPESALMIVARQGAAQLRTQEVTAELKPALLRLVNRLKAAYGPGGKSQPS